MATGLDITAGVIGVLAKSTTMPDRYPGYDVLAKRDTPSWNEPTSRATTARLATPNAPRFFNAEE